MMIDVLEFVFRQVHLEKSRKVHKCNTRQYKLYENSHKELVT
jgi:hypothetical protein